MKPLASPVLRHGVPVLVTVLFASAALPGRVDAQSLGERLRQAREQLRERAEAAANASGAMAAGCSKNDTHQCAGLVHLGTPVHGTIGRNGHKLFYRVKVDEPGILQFTLDPMPNGSFVSLVVTDARETQIGRHHFDAGQPGERILQIVAPGTYYMELNASGYVADERFALLVRDMDKAEGQAPVVARAGCSRNNTFQCAAPLPLGDRADGVIGRNGHELFYRLTTEGPGILQFALNPMPNGSFVNLTVTDAQYQEVGRHAYDAGKPGERVTRIGGAGTFYVKLVSSGYVPDERFGLGVDFTPDAGSPAAARSGCSRNDTFQCAETITLGETVEGVIGASSRDLYHRFEVARAGVYRVALSPMPNSASVQVTVADADYNQVERFAFERGEPGTREVRLPAAGTYYVRTYASGAGTAERFALQVSRAAQ